MKGRVHYDVLIVGAGIIGLSAAYHIKQNNPDLSVLVLDRNAAAAQGETAKSVAAVRDCFTSEVNRLLAKSTIEFYKHLQFESHFNLGLELVGYLWLLTEFEFRRFNAFMKRMQEQGVRLHIWEREDLADLIPDLVLTPRSEESKLLGLESIHMGVQGLNCGTVSPDMVAKYYETEFGRLGGEFQYRTEVKSLYLASKDPLGLPGEPFAWQEKVIRGVETERGMFSADRMVLATGALTPRLLDPLGIDCLVKPKKRQVFRIRAGDVLQRLLHTKGFNELDTIPLTILPRGGVHFRPVRGEKSLWIAAADDVGRPLQYEEEPAAEESFFNYSIYPILSEYFPCFKDQRPANAWAGHYDMNTLDGTPIIEEVANCMFIVGMSGSGIMKADAIGRVVAAAFNRREWATLFDGSRLMVSRLGLRDRAVGKEEFVL